MKQTVASQNREKYGDSNKQDEEPVSQYTGRTPADTAYENGINMQQLDLSLPDTTIFNDINWEVDVAVPEQVRNATTFVATQAHYSNTARLTLYGKMLKCETARPDFDAKHVASHLSQLTMHDLDRWGRYLQRFGQDDEIMIEARRCFDELFTEEEDLAVLVGVEAVLVTVAAYFKQVQGFGDPVFQQLIDAGITNRKQQTEQIEQYLQTILSADNPSRNTRIKETRDKYRTMIADQFLVEDNTFIQEPVDLPGLRQDIEEMIGQ